MTTTESTQTCAYVAKKDEPKNWNGESPSDWMLDEESWSCPHEVFEHEDVEDEEHCVFHTDPEDLPDDVDEAAAFVEAIEDANDGAERKTEFVGAIFGAFELELKTEIHVESDSPIRLDHTVFEENVKADGLVLRHSEVSFSRARFEREVSFLDAEFTGDGDVSFSEVEFTGDGEVSFSGAEFTGDGDVLFSGAEFTGDGDVSFSGAEFTGGGDVSFSGAEFTGDAIVLFNGAEFTCDGEVSFSEVDFTGDGIVLFSRAEFTGDGDVWFDGAEFTGTVSFRDSSLGNSVSFADAQFAECELEISSMADMDLHLADFTNVQLQNVDFSGANLEQAIFSRSNLYNTNFSGAKLNGAVFGDAQINQGTDFGEDVDFRVPYDPEFERATDDSASGTGRLTRVVSRYLPSQPNWPDENVGDDANSDTDEEESRLLKAARTYHTLEKIGRNNSLPELQRIGFIRRQEMHRLRQAEEASTADSLGATLSWWGKWIRSTAARLTLLYGESPWRVIGASLFVILSFGMSYPLGGFRAASGNNTELIRATSFGEWLTMLPDGIYFSMLTFTTLGFGDFQPAGWGKLLATSETALGATLLALLVFVLGRRAAR
ncbi:pentapeptide repeat-containing protein [Halogeometricum limi]|uniref:Uncharacterized protein YjbI, contains pentapeptide repeats n=1 Tax=Halogeometricum limi TaxID=555875 RepID=A0A1I6IGZ4_9EURY|nr:pentapeptide repeat-containing protein [Halogeometricum limi]SFR65590.1 Uncharacterized protein YjbI, contains pentapeptide repeats [Halogeometricum limi]